MAKPGDTVKIITSDGTYEGILMPRPELVPGDALILKLDNGYNVGIAKNKIKRIQILEGAKEVKKTIKKIKPNPKLPNVTILSTGGTISSRVDYKTGGTFPALNVEDFVANAPEILNYANIQARPISQVWSEDLTPKIWAKIAKEIYSEIKKGVNGIIVTHGTDTMHYTAAAISFMLQNLPIPVVFVGSQRSVDRGSTDAYPNLLTAVATAAKWDGAESVICMHQSTNDDINFLIRGTKARKMHTERRDAFRPINDLPLAKIDYHGNIMNQADHRVRSNAKPILNTKFDEKVALVFFYPGMSPQIIENLIKEKYHGIVIAGSGFGNISVNLFPAFRKCYKAKIPVVITSQCIYGRVSGTVYERGRRQVKELNMIYGQDMMPEIAYIKLMHVLGQTRDIAKVKELMQTNMVGEITSCTAPQSYLI
jgi:glutamyl-tRNA(Gln) amidotransferase subunit D